ncbi:MAG: hypothetical protein IIA49_10770 [Bacteroidetes bacterium]|nr:hypothetical protein [Bacteroidota bacterium]
MENQTKADILSKTSGIWKYRKIGGLDYVRKLRDEWNRPCRILRSSIILNQTIRSNSSNLPDGRQVSG